MYLDPTDDSAVSLFGRGIEGPLSMLSLLRFSEVADDSNHPELAPSEPISGRASYDRYPLCTGPLLEASGGSVDLSCLGGHFFVCPSDEQLDLVMVIRQATVSDFTSFASNQDYLAGAGHRGAALEDSRLLPLVATELPRLTRSEPIGCEQPSTGDAADTGCAHGRSERLGRIDQGPTATRARPVYGSNARRCLSRRCHRGSVDLTVRGPVPRDHRGRAGGGASRQFTQATHVPVGVWPQPLPSEERSESTRIEPAGGNPQLASGSTPDTDEAKKKWARRVSGVEPEAS